MFLLAIYLFSMKDFSWWFFPVLLLAPDLSMIGYAFNYRVGAVLYNIFHHKGVAIAIYVIGMIASIPFLILSGIILFAHSSMDRLFGYGLKYFTGFHSTHLGDIGKQKINYD